MNSAREQILATVGAALGRRPGTPAPAVPDSARVPARGAGSASAEMDLLLAQIERLGGTTRRLAGPDDLSAALTALVREEAIRKAALWDTPEPWEPRIAARLSSLGVAIVPGSAGPWELADCDLGVTGADAALPETGTLVLRASPDQPRLVSLLPRVHLAIIRPGALQPDLHQVLDVDQGPGQFVFVSGPSRTADIELTLTLGVHGPAALHVWVLDYV